MNKDRLSTERRSWDTSRIRGKNTSPELIVRRLLHRMGYRFRLHVRIPISVVGTARRAVRVPQRNIPARSVSVDILLPKYKTAIFVHGCFWHRHQGCSNCTTPTNRREWWLAKLEGNAARDQRNQAALKKLGWKVIVIWECQTAKEQTLRRVMEKLPKILCATQDDARALSNL